MIQIFIEKNRRLLQFYYWVMRIGGWVFLSIAFLAIAGHGVALGSRLGDGAEFERYCRDAVPWGTFSNGLPTGLLALGIAQLIDTVVSLQSSVSCNFAFFIGLMAPI